MKALLIGIALTVAAVTAMAQDDAGAAPRKRLPENPNGKAAAPAVKNISPRPDYWTTERFREVKPMPFPSAGRSLPQTLDDSAGEPQPQSYSDDQPGTSGPGQPPRLEPSVLQPLEKRLYVPDEQPADSTGTETDSAGPSGDSTQGTSGNVAMPLDVGFGRAYFSSQALVPPTADQSYPYSTVGRLFFTIPGQGDFVCSGAVIYPRLVLTAGHCVHSGSGGQSGWFTNFLFAPAYRDGATPYSVWQGSAAIVTTAWLNGNGQVPNAADYALIEVEDQTVDGIPRRIGEVVGYLGYQTNRLIPNHAHLLGYPVNFDRGERMHQVTAQSFRRYLNENALYGSDMGGGSSGGPWIMNFGSAAGGQAGGAEPARNQVIGVNSYGFEQPPQIVGSSTLNDNFISILNQACSRRPGNCP